MVSLSLSFEVTIVRGHHRARSPRWRGGRVMKPPPAAPLSSRISVLRIRSIIHVNIVSVCFFCVAAGLYMRHLLLAQGGILQVTLGYTSKIYMLELNQLTGTADISDDNPNNRQPGDKRARGRILQRELQSRG